jgi:predicted negative regulator of RcsB-dependent stress response
MAQQLDLQEQEQVDALKAFWAQWGNLIIWVATIILALFAAYNGLHALQRSKALTASTLYGELEVAAQAGDADRAAGIFADMKKQSAVGFLPKFLYTVPAYVEQGALLTAKVQSDKGKTADAMATLQWVADNGNEEDAAVARLRLAGLLADGKKPEDALKQLEQVKTPSFAPLVADRRGDILLAKGDKDGAKAAYKAAFDALPATQQYRFVVEAKLTALGAAPAVSAASAAAAAAPTGAGE